MSRSFFFILTLLASLGPRIGASDEENPVPQLEAEAAKGVAAAQFRLAEQLLEGKWTPVDEGRAVELMRAAAEAGIASAQYELAEMYASGMGESRHDGETPFRLYFEAARKGHGNAMIQLARRYRLGFGTNKDLLEAARWTFRSIGRTVDPLREFLDPRGEPLVNLAPEDRLFAEFLSDYLKAQRAADPAAMLRIGRAFLAGENGRPNYPTAALWLSYAARLGNAEAAKFAEQAREKLTPEQRLSVDKDLATLETERRMRNFQRRE